MIFSDLLEASDFLRPLSKGSIFGRESLYSKGGLSNELDGNKALAEAVNLLMSPLRDKLDEKISGVFLAATETLVAERLLTTLREAEEHVVDISRVRLYSLKYIHFLSSLLRPFLMILTITELFH